MDNLSSAPVHQQPYPMECFSTDRVREERSHCPIPKIKKENLSSAPVQQQPHPMECFSTDRVREERSHRPIQPKKKGCFNNDNRHTRRDNHHKRGVTNFNGNGAPKKRRKLQNNSNNSNSNNSTLILDGEPVAKLDPSDPVHANRIQKRREMVKKGKNTVGYDEYLRRIPKRNRIPRHEDYPQTPDHTADIPNKRWLGLVKAWRKNLHKYDPPELQRKLEFKTENVKIEDGNRPSSSAKSGMLKPKRPQTVQERQIAEASTNGLLVDFGSTSNSDASSVKRALFGSQEGSSAVSDSTKLSQSSGSQQSLLDEDESEILYGESIFTAEDEGMEELDRWEKQRDGDDEDLMVDFDDDSDDDLL